MKPSSVDSVTTNLRAFSFKGSTQIQKVTLSPGDASVRLTYMEAFTRCSASPAARGIQASRTKLRTRTRGRHIRIRRLKARSRLNIIRHSPPAERGHPYGKSANGSQ